MTGSGQSDSSLEHLGPCLRQHDASISIDHLFDHGWQVKISNPGGSLWVHGGTRLKPEVWSDAEEPTLVETIEEAIARAESEGWW